MSKINRCRIQRRDLDIMRYIRDSKTMNVDQVRRRFWQGKSVVAVVQRMKQLIESGLIVKVNYDLLRVQTHYYLTAKGLEFLIANGLANESSRIAHPEPADIIRSDFQHNMRVTDIRIVMETDKKIRVNKWISDDLIKSDPDAYGLGREHRAPLKGIRSDPEKEGKYNFRIPDAIIEFEDQEHEVKAILEYEHGRYVRWKFNAYIAAWEERWPDYQKFIVAATPERTDTIRAWCLEDLKKRYRIDIGKGSTKVEDLAESYMFTDYHSMIEKGIMHCGLKTPISDIKLKPIKS